MWFLAKQIYYQTFKKIQEYSEGMYYWNKNKYVKKEYLQYVGIIIIYNILINVSITRLLEKKAYDELPNDTSSIN